MSHQISATLIAPNQTVQEAAYKTLRIADQRLQDIAAVATASAARQLGIQLIPP